MDVATDQGRMTCGTPPLSPKDNSAVNNYLIPSRFEIQFHDSFCKRPQGVVQFLGQVIATRSEGDVSC